MNRVKAKNLLSGSVVASGESVVNVYTTVAQYRQWGSRKVFVELSRNGKTRVAEWNANTLIGVRN